MSKHFFPGSILLPNGGFEKWAVIACDQHTSERQYWDAAEQIVGGAPSSLRVILPEIYLNDNPEKRINAINAAMRDYLDGDVLTARDDCMIYTERTQSDGRVRRGIVGMINLDEYEYESGAKSLIRATEQTVTERIPPRIRIRENASLELPHILLLFDDADNTVIEPLDAGKERFDKLYDFELMLNGGHIRGYALDNAAISQVQSALDALIAENADKLLFAVGDGNHSLATAKECAKLKSGENSNIALVEIVNIHDRAIDFEPIYRVLFNCEPRRVIEDLTNELGFEGGHRFDCIYSGAEQTIELSPTAKLPVGTLQRWLDAYLNKHPEISIDYVHGTDAVKQLCSSENTLGFLFSGMKKNELFEAIIRDGSLPRKTFSMGHANDKRYYIEARKIK